jgi:chromosome segregation ATPase
MIYLIAQTWLFLAIACLIGMLMSYFLLRNQKSERQAQLETEALEARNRAIATEKELDEYRGRLVELEGLPASARASRIASREEMAQRISMLERELATLQANEKRSAEDCARLKDESETFRTRYLEARAKWDEYKARAEALAQAAAPLDLGSAKVMPDDAMRKRLLELEGALAEVSREKDRIGEQARAHMARVRELERAAAGGTPASDPRAQEIIRSMQVRLSELEGQLAQATGERDAQAQQVLQMLTRIRELEATPAPADTGPVDARLAAAMHARDTALNDITILSERVADAEARAAAVQREREASVTALNLSKARIGELEARLASGFAAARETDALRSRILDLQDKLSAADVALSKSLERLRQETDPLRARIVELENRLAHAAATNTQGDTIAVLQSADNVELRAKLEAAEARALRADVLAAEVEALNKRLMDMPLTLNTPVADPAEVKGLMARIRELETVLERVVERPVEPVTQQSPELVSRVRELESALERMTREAAATEELRGEVAALEARLADAVAQARPAAPDSETEMLKSRLADVEARLLSQSQAVAETGTLRHRVQQLEAMLHEAAKSRDEAAVLRAKLAELDGRLGQTMKALAELRARNSQNEAV